MDQHLLPKRRGHLCRSITLLSAFALTGCAPTLVQRDLPSPVVTVKEEQLDPKLLEEVLGYKVGDAYRVGPGDTLLVAVYNHPELSLTAYSPLGVSTGRPVGLVVDNDGTIQFPLIGSVKAEGRTLDQLRDVLQNELSAYVKDPKVTVQIVFHGNIRYYLIGQFHDPGLKYSDRPLHLLEGLSLGGSIQLERASLRTAYVVRNEKRLPINFRRLVREGDLKQNIPLRSGDVVVVPDNTVEQAFVFAGSAGSAARGGAVPFRNGRLDLLQALAQAGYGFRERVQGRLSQTRVIRSDGDRGQLFIVNAARILAGEAAPFELAPGDVVFVPARAITNWNQVLEQLLPTLQTVAGLLTPFVQIRFLQNTN